MARRRIATKPTKPTERPWRAIDGVVVVTAEDVGFSTWIAQCTVGGAARGEQYANAALIAQAVNSFDSMVEALDRVEAVLSIVEPRSHKAQYLETLAEVRAALQRARAA